MSEARKPDTSSSEGNRLIRLRDVQRLTGLSRSYIYDLVSRQILPQPIKLVPGGTSRAWVEAEILAWVEQRIAERDQEVANA